jgi:tetratricopeptide (TPR) repeat protein
MHFEFTTKTLSLRATLLVLLCVTVILSACVSEPSETPRKPAGSVTAADGRTPRTATTTHLRDSKSLVEEIVAMTRLLKKSPRATKARTRRATLYRQLGLYDRAENDIEFVLSKSKNAEAYYQLALIKRHANHDLKAAIACLDKAIVIEPHHAEALFERGQLKKIVGESAEAFKDRKKALSLKPSLAEDFAQELDNPSVDANSEAILQALDNRIQKNNRDTAALEERALALAKLGDFEQALHDVETGLKLNPNNEDLMYVQGWVLLRAKDYHAALPVLLRAFESKPSAAIALDISVAYEFLKRNEDALTWLNKAVKLAPKNVECLEALAIAHQKLGHYDESLKCFDKTIKIKPDFARAFYERGRIYSDRMETSLAIADFGHAVAINPELASAWSGRGYARARIGQFALALSDFDKALELDPKDHHTHTLRGMLYRKLNEMQLAATDFETALALCPNYELALQNTKELFPNENRSQTTPIKGFREITPESKSLP